MPTAVKNRRLGSRKTRTGCRTCKIRRVKCDEAQPSCLRCTSTGRRCDGYELILRRSRSDQPSLRTSLIPIVQANNNERRSFDFYLQRTAPILSGALDTRFWKQFIPQLSVSQPAIWDAVVAISSLTEHPPWDNSPNVQGLNYEGPVTDQAHRFALDLYSRAISRFISATTEPDAVLVAIVSCILFICIEFLQDNPFRAISLFRAGRRLLNDYISKDHKGSTLTTSLIKELIPIFTRLEVTLLLTRFEVIRSHPEILADFTGGVLDYKMDYSNHSPIIISSLEDARTHLYDIMAIPIPFIKDASFHKMVENFQSPVSTDLLCFQQGRLKRAREWHASFLQFLRNKKNDNTLDAGGSSILLVQYEAVIIMLSTIFKPFESCYDEYNHHFENIVRQARIAIQSTSSSLITTTKGSLTIGLQDTFSFENGIVINLFYTGFHCRDPRIRRGALQLMYQAPRKEGLHKAIPLARIVETVIEIEEEHQGRLPNTSTIPEEQRVKDVQPFRSPSSGTSKAEWYLKYRRYRHNELGAWENVDGIRPLKVD